MGGGWRAGPTDGACPSIHTSGTQMPRSTLDEEIPGEEETPSFFKVGRKKIKQLHSNISKERCAWCLEPQGDRVPEASSHVEDQGMHRSQVMLGGEATDRVRVLF